MFYIEIINNEITRYTENEAIAKNFYANYKECETEPIRAFDKKLYLNEKDIPNEVNDNKNKNDKLMQINELENKITPRRMREATLGIKESIDFIADIEEQIKILREVI